MEEVLKYVLLVFAGAVAGMINIIAGAGSLITLPILIGFGLPPTIANGTNRIAVIFQDISATYNFLKTKKLPVRIGLKLLLPTVIGGVPGAILASGLTDSILNIIIVSILILMLVYMVWQPQKLTVTSNSSPKDNVGLFTFMLFLVIGFYAGFIQAGATYIWFAALLWRIKVDMVVADALKIFLNLVLTPFVLVVFFYCHQVSFA
jgi:Predicted permeases